MIDYEKLLGLIWLIVTVAAIGWIAGYNHAKEGLKSGIIIFLLLTAVVIVTNIIGIAIRNHLL